MHFTLTVLQTDKPATPPILPVQAVVCGLQEAPRRALCSTVHMPQERARVPALRCHPQWALWEAVLSASSPLGRDDWR